MLSVCSELLSTKAQLHLEYALYVELMRLLTGREWKVIEKREKPWVRPGIKLRIKSQLARCSTSSRPT